MRPSSPPWGLMGQLSIYLWEMKQINGYSSLLSNRTIKSYRAVFLWKAWLHEPSPQTCLTGRRQLGDPSSICSGFHTFHVPLVLLYPLPFIIFLGPPCLNLGHFQRCPKLVALWWVCMQRRHMCYYLESQMVASLCVLRHFIS